MSGRVPRELRGYTGLPDNTEDYLTQVGNINYSGHNPKG